MNDIITVLSEADEFARISADDIACAYRDRGMPIPHRIQLVLDALKTASSLIQSCWWLEQTDRYEKQEVFGKEG